MSLYLDDPDERVRSKAKAAQPPGPQPRAGVQHRLGNLHYRAKEKTGSFEALLIVTKRRDIVQSPSNARKSNRCRTRAVQS